MADNAPAPSLMPPQSSGMSLKVKQKIASLTGAEKAAIILMALGQDMGPVWDKLGEDEIREVSHAMSGLGAVDAELVESLISDFVSKMSGQGTLMGTYEQTHKLLMNFLPPDKVESLMEEIRGPAGRTMWDKLGNVNEVVLANYLKNEYPQTVAVVLSKVKSDHASRVLGALPEGVLFNVYTYELDHEAYAKKPEELDAKQAKKALEFVDKQSRRGAKDIWQILETVVSDPGIDTIYLLSSGEPDTGLYVHWSRVTRHLKDLNRFHKVTVHTVAYSDNQWHKDQLEKISEATGGEFRSFE